MESSSLLYYAALAPVGIAAGFINTVGGGGSLLSMPMLIFMGLPGTTANATNRVSVLAQSIFAARGFRTKGVDLPTPYTYYLAAAALAGGLVGSILALLIPDASFNRILAVVMLVDLAIILRDPGARRGGAAVKEQTNGRRQFWGIALFFLLSIYGGLLQAGVGFLVITLLSQLHRFGMAKINYIKSFAAILYTGISVLVFALEGKIFWGSAAILAAGQSVGAWYASRWSVDKEDRWVRRILVVALIALAIKLWFF